MSLAALAYLNYRQIEERVKFGGRVAAPSYTWTVSSVKSFNSTFSLYLHIPCLQLIAGH